MTMRSLLVLAIVACTAHRASASNCNISASPFPFGTYDVFGGSDLTISPIILSFSCNGDESSVTIQIGNGAGSTSFAPRSLTQGAQPKLDYYFYTNAARTTIWGDGTGGSSVYTQAATKGVQYSVTIYGRIVAGQDVNVGTYSEATPLAVRIYDETNKLRDSTTLSVTATVVQACKISTGTLAFGNYDPVSVNNLAGADLNVDAANAVSVRCTRGSTASTISLGKGLQPAPASSFGRYLASGASRLAYQIYTTAARTTIWGDGTSSTATQGVASPTSFLTSQGFTAYGTVPKGQDVVAGSYLDTVSATVNF